MAAPDKDVIETEGTPGFLTDPICKPIGLAFEPTDTKQAQEFMATASAQKSALVQTLTGLITIKEALSEQSGPITITSTNPKFLAVQPMVYIKAGQTTAVVNAIAVVNISYGADPSDAAATGATPPLVAYVYAAFKGVATPFAKVEVPTTMAAAFSPGQTNQPKVESLTFPTVYQNTLSITGKVTLTKKAPAGGILVSIFTSDSDAFSPSPSVVKVIAGRADADVHVNITHLDWEVIIAPAAAVGGDEPTSALPVKVQKA